ncbi:UGMP family protein [Candidatus Micrarchaeota archaeon]|nr:MAG: UGMP family protein [Candidatus Micrarchaeota archaeon]
MRVMGIESTAHTFGVGIVENGKIIANERDMYLSEKGGIVPTEAAEHHRKLANEVMRRALSRAGLSLEDIDLVGLSVGPGLPPCLKAGLDFAKSISDSIVEVNHCVAHIEIGRFVGKLKDPLTVYVSGGNTQIIAYAGGRYRIFGETLDIGLGNAYDKFARSIGLPMPGGPKVEELAKKGKYKELPYTVKGMSLVYAGLVTAAEKLAKRYRIEDACYSFQETALSMLAEVSERALAHTKKRELLLTGGVAANKRLREIMKAVAEEHGASFYVPDREYCGDNGAMIAITASLIGKAKKSEDVDIKPNWRADDVEVLWIKK